MNVKEEIGYIFFQALIILFVILVLFAIDGVVATSGSMNNESLFLSLVYGGSQGQAAWRMVDATILHSNLAYLPMIYGDNKVTPTPSPTPSPTPTATPVPGELWTWVARAGNVEETTEIFAVIPGYCCELIGQKSGKTIYVQAVCPAEPTCEIFPAPPEIPPPFAWGDVEKLVYDANSQQVCSIQWPFNCVDVR